jgi:coproporphyrinogen III oxidase
MSLPPTARFVYDYEPPEGTPERELLEVCRHPREWV